jgi:hypothetical protein
MEFKAAVHYGQWEAEAEFRTKNKEMENYQ